MPTSKILGGSFEPLEPPHPTGLPSQQPSTARKLSLDFTLNGTHSHLESTRLTSSEHSLIAVSASVPQPLCCSVPLIILRIFCHTMVTPQTTKRISMSSACAKQKFLEDSMTSIDQFDAKHAHLQLKLGK